MCKLRKLGAAYYGKLGNMFMPVVSEVSFKNLESKWGRTNEWEGACCSGPRPMVRCSDAGVVAARNGPRDPGLWTELRRPTMVREKWGQAIQEVVRMRLGEGKDSDTGDLGRRVECLMGWRCSLWASGLSHRYGEMSRI
jgi:hypothetical protein